MRNKDLNKLRKAAVKQGWRIKPTENHEQWYSPDGKTIVTVGLNLASHENLTNIKVRLRNAGLKGI